MTASATLLDAALAAIRRLPPLRYTDISGDILHVIPVGMSGWVAVIGDPPNGSYEWVVQPEAGWSGADLPPLEHSDSGYGCPASAMRDGLTAALGCCSCTE